MRAGFACRIFLFLFSGIISGCAALKPSADLRHFESNRVDRLNDTLIPSGKVCVTFFGTSTLLFDDGESQLLIDGFFTRPSVLKTGFGKIKSNKKLISSLLEQQHINRLKAVLVCHSHYDHLMDAPLICQMTGATLHGSSSTLKAGQGEGLADSSMCLFQPGRAISIGRFTVTAIVSKHTPPFRVMGKTNATNPLHPDIDAPLKQPAKADAYIEGGTYDFYIQHGSHALLVKASTNYLDSALNPYRTEIIFLGVAMLGVQTDTFQNQFYTQTIAATGAQTVVPIHWDNFMKPLRQPLQALPRLVDNLEKGLGYLKQKTEAQGVRLKIMQSFDRYVLF